MTYQIAASILSANFAELGKECQGVLAAGAHRIHFDVMDNHYVPNLTVGPLVCQALRDYGIEAPIDVHLMTQPVDNLIIEFARAGANLITFHPEASLHVDRSLQLIRDHGCEAGLALNPATPLTCLTHVLEHLDEVLIMSVNPGFAGQRFIPTMLQKISTLKQWCESQEKNIRIAVDGGIGLANIRTVAQMGANVFIMGSAIFAHPDKNYPHVLQQLQHELAR